METVTIPKKEYEKLKNKSKVNMDLVRQLIKGLEDVKAGRVRRVK